MKKWIALFLIISLSGILSGNYSSLTAEEKKKVNWAFKKSKVYNDLITNNYTVKILETVLLQKEETTKGKFLLLVTILFSKISKSTGEEIHTKITIPIKLQVTKRSSIFSKVLIMIATFATGFFAGRMIQ